MAGSSASAPRDGVDFERILCEARRLRDFLVRSRSRRNGALSKALRPFEFDGSSSPGGEERNELYTAFQQAHAEALNLSDEHTVAQVLAGNSPYMQGRNGQRRRTFLFTIVGILLAFVTLSYSNWSGRAALVLSEVEKFEGFDYSASLFRLVDMQAFLDKTVVEPEQVATEPVLAFKNELDDLIVYYWRETRLLGDINALLADETPISQYPRRIAQEICWALGGEARPAGLAIPADPPDNVFAGSLVGSGFAIGSADAQAAEPRLPARPEPSLAVPRGQVSFSTRIQNRFCRLSAAIRYSSPPSATKPERDDFTAYRLGEANLIKFFAEEFPKLVRSSGRDSNLKDDLTETRLRVQDRAVDLRQELAIVQNWWLPALYGALGTFVFCLWRILKPDVAQLPYCEILPRLVFGAFAGITLSMLFVPANILALDPSAGRPLVYLTAFVFGYSVETFMAALNNVNEVIRQAIRQKKA